MSQLQLFPITQVEQKGRTLEEAFRAFHEANPHILENLLHLARIARDAGCRRMGIKAIFEELRWNYNILTGVPQGEFKLNNNYSSYYARLLVKTDPSLEGLFELRSLKAGARKRIIVETCKER